MLSMTLPADPDSLVKEIKRIHLQSFVCRNFLHKNILKITTVLFGWKINADNTLAPNWFNGSKLHSSMMKSKEKYVQTLPATKNLKHGSPGTKESQDAVYDSSI